MKNPMRWLGLSLVVACVTSGCPLVPDQRDASVDATVTTDAGNGLADAALDQGMDQGGYLDVAALDSALISDVAIATDVETSTVDSAGPTTDLGNDVAQDAEPSPDLAQDTTFLIDTSTRLDGSVSISCLQDGTYSIPSQAKAHGLNRESIPSGGPPCVPFSATASATLTIQLAAGVLRTISLDSPPPTPAYIYASWSPTDIASWPAWTVTTSSASGFSAKGGIVCNTGPSWYPPATFTLDLDCNTGVLTVSGACTADWPSGCTPDWVYEIQGQTTVSM